MHSPCKQQSKLYIHNLPIIKGSNEVEMAIIPFWWHAITRIIEYEATKCFIFNFQEGSLFTQHLQAIFLQSFSIFHNISFDTEFVLSLSDFSTYSSIILDSYDLKFLVSSIEAWNDSYFLIVFESYKMTLKNKQKMKNVF